VDPMTPLLPLLHLAQICFALYTARFSYESIDYLAGGDTAQRVAKYSSKAANKVFHARGTQTAGVTSLVTSFLLSLFLALYPAAFSSTEESSTHTRWPEQGRATRVVLNVGQAALIVGSAAYIGRIWKTRPKIPTEKAQEYNNAITRTNEMRVRLQALAVLWGVTAALEVSGFILPI